MRLLLVLVLCSTAYANEHVMQRGETLEHVAAAAGCSVEVLLRANHVDTVILKVGTVVVVPHCTMQTRARTREKRRVRSNQDDDRAEQALAVIDGATMIADKEEPVVTEDKPWRGKLQNAEKLPSGDGYNIRRPNRAFGAPHVVEHLQQAIEIVRALYPDVHTLAIGDLSAEHGGKLANHVSHQSGLDVDVGFYYHVVPEGYPDRFAAAGDELDLEATWALLTAFARTTQLDDGVTMIFLDYDIQARLHAWARKRGTPDDQLAAILQYPRGKDALAGLVRHWPNHTDHMHVRFKKK